MRKLISSTAAAGLLFTALAFTAPAANAAPITCPNGQSAQKINGDWVCVNNPGKGDPNTEDPRNPNR
jgi:hypothetical protein